MRSRRPFATATPVSRKPKGVQTTKLRTIGRKRTGVPANTDNTRASANSAANSILTSFSSRPSTSTALADSGLRRRCNRRPASQTFSPLWWLLGTGGCVATFASWLRTPGAGEIITAEVNAAFNDSAYPPQMLGARIETYKTIGDSQLRLYVFAPDGHTHGAKSAVRWLRANADRLGIDPERIAAGGGSAGGHLAATTGVVPGLHEATGDPNVSSVPNALVLFNPFLMESVADGAPADFGAGNWATRFVRFEGGGVYLLWLFGN